MKATFLQPFPFLALEPKFQAYLRYDNTKWPSDAELMEFMQATSCYICKQEFDFETQYYGDKFERILQKMGLRTERLVKRDIPKKELKDYSLLHLHHEHYR